MGAVSVGRSLLTRGLSFIQSLTQAGGTAAGQRAATAVQNLGGIRTLAAGLLGTGAGAGAAVALSGAGAQVFAPGTAGAGRSMFLRLEDGSQILVSPSGKAARATVFIPAGTPLPQGSTVVSVSADGQLFGIRKKRRRRTFQGEIDRTKNAIQSARSLLTVCNKK